MSEDTIHTLSEQAMACIEHGRIDEALQLFRQITHRDHDDAEAWMMLGAIHKERGEYAQSVECLQRALSLDPDDAEAHFCLAGVLFVQRDFGNARAHGQRAVDLDPDYGEAWLLLGGAQAALNRHPEAESSYRRARAVLPGVPDPVIGLAQSLRAQGRSDEAEPLYRQVRTHCQEVARSRPGDATAHQVLAELHAMDGHYLQAVAELRTALEHSPGELSAYIQLADILHYLGAGAEMLEVGTEAVRRAPDLAIARIKCAEALNILGRLEEAFAEVERALAISPDSSEALALSATILERLDRPREGLDRLAPLLDEPDNQNLGVYLAYANLARNMGHTKDAIETLEKYLSGTTPLHKGHRIATLFTLGHLYDHARDYNKAFENIREANDLKHSILTADFNPAAYRERIDTLISSFTEAGLLSHSVAGDPSELPIFVVGMPRSGTTLTEQTLASHREIEGAGELRDMRRIVESLPQRLNAGAYPDCLDHLDLGTVADVTSAYLKTLRSVSATATRIIDKMPGNFMHLGLIQRLFPNARVIHCQRDPIDTCLSCYFQNFTALHAYAYRLEDLAEFYLGYQRLMAHWRRVLDIPIFDLRYEDLIADQERTTRALVDFCGLKWDEACLSFHENRRFAATASYNQVRQPIYTRSVQRWKNYESFLSPLTTTISKEFN